MESANESLGSVATSPKHVRGRFQSILLVIGLVLLALVPLLFVARCGKSREAARRELDQKGVPFSEAAFVESAKHGDVNTVKLFLAAGMNPDSRTENGETVLMNTIGANADAMTETLLKGGANPNARTGNGSSALHLAALIGNARGAKLLVSYRADVNLKSNIGETSLMIAALRGFPEVVKILLRAGADVSAKDERGETPLMHAMERNHTEVIEILKQAGARE